jgi:pimeloyl-ACP methyl ester carboxylesterase
MTKRNIGWTGLLLVLTSCVLRLFVGEPARADSDFAALPPPGRLVKVDGHQLHLNCTGAGTPTVILEEGAGGGSLNWTWIQRKVAATTRVCSYDRPGHAWSKETETSRDAETVSRELDALLKAAGEKGPFVAAGHSLGGPYARMFAARQGRNVVGLVLVDATPPNALTALAEAGISLNASPIASFIASHKALFQAVDGIGLVKFRHDIDWNDLPPDAAPVMRAYLLSHERARTAIREQDAVPETLRQIEALDGVGAMPVVVISADRWVDKDPTIAAQRAELDKKLQRNWLAISSNSRFLIVPESDHLSLLSNKKHADAVSDAIIRLVHNIRPGRSGFKS